jgi:hypothetical protein
MIVSWKNPDVPVQSGEKSNLHSGAASGQIVARCRHQILGRKSAGKLGTKRISGTGRKDDEGRGDLATLCAQPPIARSSPDFRDTVLDNLRSGRASSIQEKTIEYATRKDCNWPPKIERHSLTGWTDQLALLDPITFHVFIAEIFILHERLVGYASAARFFPSQLFIE